MTGAGEAGASFACFGSSCDVFVTGEGPEGPPESAVAMARSRLLGWHASFSRFEPDSELSRLNDDPRARVPVSALMARFVDAVVRAGAQTGGLVDATLLDEIEIAGYTHDLQAPMSLSSALALAPERAPAAARSSPGWQSITVDLSARVVARPPGLRLDSGGLAKGLFADVLADALAAYPVFAVNCAGDLRVGGADGIPRAVHVASPFDERTLHTFELIDAGVATSGIGRRSWLDGPHPAHHLLDPSTGRPAFTGVVQVTALAPDALTAELRAKAAILSGPAGSARWLPDGGVVVFDDGGHLVIEPPDAAPPATRR